MSDARLVICLALLCTATVARAERFVVISNGETVGGLSTEQRGNEITVDYHVEDNGRGPRSREEILLGGDLRLPRHWKITGSSEAGAKTRETFAWLPTRATWQTLNDKGSVAANPATQALYLAQGASPYAYAIYLEALLAAPGHTLPTWPTGKLRAEPIPLGDVQSLPGEIPPPAPSANSPAPLANSPPSVNSRPWAHCHAWALWGLEVAPVLALEANGRFQAVLSADRLIIPASWRQDAPALLQLATALDKRLLHDLTRKVVHHWDRPVYLRNVHVLDPATGLMSPAQTVVTFRGRITGVVADDTNPPAGSVSIDGAAGTLMPALFDMHAHVSSWQGPLYLAAGVTTVRDMGNDNTTLLDLVAEFDSGQIAGPAVVTSGFLEGRSPFSARDGFVVDRLSEGLRSVRWYADHGYWQLKLYNSIQPEWVAPLAAEAHRLGLRVAGHVPAYMSSAQAIQAGYDEMTHLNQLLLSLLIDPSREDTRTPLRFMALGERLAKLDLHGAPFQDLLRLMQAHHTALDPTAAVLSEMLLARPGQVTPVDAPWLSHVPAPVQRSRKAAWLDIPAREDARYRASQTRLLEALKVLHDAGIRIVPGTDDAPAFLLQSELETWQRAGIPPQEILRLATSGCATYLGQDRELGVIQRGRRADLMLVRGDPTRDVGALRHIELVMKAGAVVFPAEIYAAMQIAPFVPSAIATE